jgi:hypothetical protein
VIERLVAALRVADLDLDAVEVADLLWLARALRAARRDEASRDERRPDRGEKREGDPDERDQTDSERPPSPEPTAVATLPSLRPPELAPGAAVPLRFAGGAALPQPLALARALRPLRRWVPSRTAWELDEPASAASIAETRVWRPVLRPASERWLAVALVFDGSRSMRLWLETARDLRRVLSTLGAFRDVRSWTLAGRFGDEAAVVPGLGAEGRAVRPARELVEPAGRRLVLVLTDCVSPEWCSGAVERAVERWARHGPVAIVQALPPALWGRTALASLRAVRLRAAAPGAPTAQYGVSSRLPRSTCSGVAVPVVSLDASGLRELAGLVAGAAVEVRGYALDAGGATRVAAVPRTAIEHLDRFLASAPPPALRLASLLAAVPITLRIARHVRETLVPQATLADLALVYLGGFLVERAGQDSTAPEDRLLDMPAPVRERLLEALPVPSAVAVLRAVSAHLLGEPADGPDGTLEALALDPRLAAPGTAFAELAASTLERMGGDHADLAARLRARAEAQATGTARVPSALAANVTDIARVIDEARATVTTQRHPEDWAFLAVQYDALDHRIARGARAARLLFSAWLAGTYGGVPPDQITELDPPGDGRFIDRDTFDGAFGAFLARAASARVEGRPLRRAYVHVGGYGEPGGVAMPGERAVSGAELAARCARAGFAETVVVVDCPTLVSEVSTSRGDELDVPHLVAEALRDAIGQGVPGELTSQLLEAFRALAAEGMPVTAAAVAGRLGSISPRTANVLMQRGRIVIAEPDAVPQQERDGATARREVFVARLRDRLPELKQRVAEQLAARLRHTPIHGPFPTDGGEATILDAGELTELSFPEDALLLAGRRGETAATARLADVRVRLLVRKDEDALIGDPDYVVVNRNHHDAVLEAEQEVELSVGADISIELEDDDDRAALLTVEVHDVRPFVVANEPPDRSEFARYPDRAPRQAAVVAAAARALHETTRSRYNQVLLATSPSGARRGDAPRLFVVADRLAPAKDGYREASLDGIIGTAFRSGRTRYARDVRTDKAYIAAVPETRSELAVPVWLGERVVGVLNAESERRDAFPAPARDAVEGVARRLGSQLLELEWRPPPHADALPHVSEPITVSAAVRRLGSRLDSETLRVLGLAVATARAEGQASVGSPVLLRALRCADGAARVVLERPDLSLRISRNVASAPLSPAELASAMDGCSGWLEPGLALAAADTARLLDPLDLLALVVRHGRTAPAETLRRLAPDDVPLETWIRRLAASRADLAKPPPRARRGRQGRRLDAYVIVVGSSAEVRSIGMQVRALLESRERSFQWVAYASERLIRGQETASATHPRVTQGGGSRAKRLLVVSDGSASTLAPVMAALEREVGVDARDRVVAIAPRGRATATKVRGARVLVVRSKLTEKDTSAILAALAADPDDTQKGKWGGEPVRSGRRLTANVTPAGHGWYDVVLEVRTLPRSPPLRGAVVFHLHETFPTPRRTVRVKSDVAHLELEAYGAFTVGAVADGGRTHLELDLAELPDAPAAFRRG